MGTAASQEDENKVGYRVLGVLPDSPASKASLVSFFDFLSNLYKGFRSFNYKPAVY